MINCKDLKRTGSYIQLELVPILSLVSRQVQEKHILKLGARLVKDHPVDTGPDALQRNLDFITILQPHLRLAAHAHALGSIK